jgi:hypothetical protein
MTGRGQADAILLSVKMLHSPMLAPPPSRARCVSAGQVRTHAELEVIQNAPATVDTNLAFKAR